MKTSREWGIPLIKAFEGCLAPVSDRPGYFTTYYCPAGVLTIGYGHTNLGNVAPHIVPGMVMSKHECEEALANDMRKFERRVHHIVGEHISRALTQNEFDALVSFDFNTGGLDRSSIPRKIAEGRMSEVAPTLARWNKANGQVLNGLVRRRKAEGELFDGKKEQAMRTAGARFEPQPKRVNKPTPPPTEIAKRAAPETGAIVLGGTTAGAGATQKDTGSHIAAGVGVVVLIVAIVFIIMKYRKVAADWA